MALLSRVILNTSLCVKWDAVGGECLFLFILLFASVFAAREVSEVSCIFIFFSLRLVRAPSQIS